MAAAVAHGVFDAETYLAWEVQQTEKHEYMAGEAFAMVGARRNHVVVSGNLYAALPVAWWPLWLHRGFETALDAFYPDIDDIYDMEPSR
ncbi:MAG: hypothetical protein R3F37_04530 [Candidatus Competibacteraceae bacterium]